MNHEVIILLSCHNKKINPDFAGLMDFPNVHFRKFSSFYNDVSTSLVDLPAKLTGLRTSGKHAKPQRAEFQVHGLGVTTSHRSAPDTITPHPLSATSHPHHTISTDNISFLLKTMQCQFWFVVEDLERNLSTGQTVGLVCFRDRLRPSFESILDSEHLNCLG